MAVISTPEREGKRTTTPVGTRSRTKQSFIGETNINRIMEKYYTTGLVSHINRREPRYGDFSNAPDFMTALNRVKEVQQLFADLPSKVRNACDNDPGKLLELVYDPARVEEVRALGLIPPGEEPTPAQEAVAAKAAPDTTPAESGS